jgi:hypothetical protein
LSNLLTKNNIFEWIEHCKEAFVKLKNFLTSAHVIQPPDWSLPFEIMCDVSDYVMGVVLGQRKDKKPYVIYYASKTLNNAQMNYTTTEKELLAIVFACEKFLFYLVGSPVVVFSDHAALNIFFLRKILRLDWCGGFCYFKNLISQSKTRKASKMLSQIICQD